MPKNLICLVLSLLLLLPFGSARAENGIESVTVEGAPIASKHFQSGEENFRERHFLGVVKIATENYGNWGLYYLAPNSVDDTSFGAGYVTDPYTVPVGPLKLELSAALGLVTGYQNYPVPLLAGEARLVMYEKGPWNAGLAMAAMPYYMEDEDSGDNEWGVVATTPFLSVRYNFQ
jgi:hypothetical protein